jgi:hypothetical protein
MDDAANLRELRASREQERWAGSYQRRIDRCRRTAKRYEVELVRRGAL